MVGTIGFAGSKARNQRRVLRWLRRLGLSHLAASMAAGALVGALMATAGAALSGLTGGTLTHVGGVLLLVFAVAELMGLPISWLSRARQVPLSWKHVFPAPMSATLYGGVLGFGLLTTIYYWSFPALLVGMVATGRIALGVAAGIAFGAGRALPVFMGLTTTDETILDRRTDRLQEFLDRRPWVPRLLGAATIALTAGLFLGSK